MESRTDAHEPTDEEAAFTQSIADEFGLQPVEVEALGVTIAALELHHADGGFGSANPVFVG